MCKNVRQGFPPDDGLPQAVSLLKILMYVLARFPPEMPTRGRLAGTPAADRGCLRI